MVRIFPPKNNLDEKQKIIHITKSNMYNQKNHTCNMQYPNNKTISTKPRWAKYNTKLWLIRLPGHELASKTMTVKVENRDKPED